MYTLWDYTLIYAKTYDQANGHVKLIYVSDILEVLFLLRIIQDVKTMQLSH